MKFPKRTIFILLALLIILNIILRLPATPHEIGWDSFTIHALANSISTFGEARWWVHPAAIGGFYPYSEESVVPFLLSGISQSTGIDMEWTIWLFSVLIGVFSAFTAYLMAGAIRDDELFKYLVAFGFSISAGGLYFTTWTVSTRGLFVVLLPLFVYLLLKTRTSSIRYSALTVILVILLVVTHHLVYFIIPISVSYFAVVIFYKLKSYVRFVKVPNSFVSIFPLICFLIIVSIVFTKRLFFLTGTRYILVDILMTYARYIGLLSIVAIGGFTYLLFKYDRSFEEWFLLITVMSLAPFLGNLIYTKWVILPFAFLLVGMGLTNIAKMHHRRKKSVFIVIVVILLLSVCMAAYYQSWHNLEQKDIPAYWTRYPSEATYESALWAKENIDGNMVGYGGSITPIRIFAYSGVPTFSGSRACDLAYGFVNLADLNVTRIPLSIEWFENEPYVITSKTPGTEWYTTHLPENNVNSKFTQNLFSKHNISYIIENKDVYGGIFIQSVQRDKDSVYDNGKICLWELGGEDV